jgi:GNAT superfamily N-acetyltransferase
MKIRKMYKEESEIVSRLIKLVLNKVNTRDYSDSIIKNLEKMFTPERIISLSGKRDIFIALEGNHILGTASLAEDFIAALFVHPKYHNKGIGTKLLETLENLARKKNHDYVRLSSSITALEFYIKRGYLKGKKSLNHEYGETYEMEKRL